MARLLRVTNLLKTAHQAQRAHFFADYNPTVLVLYVP